MESRTVLVIFGPKGVGKTHVGRLLQRTLGVYHVDADPLILDLTEKGIRPDPTFGWLEPVQSAVEEALESHDVVAVEATGAWPTDWEIVDRFKERGVAVKCLKLTAAKEVAAARAAGRTDPRVPTTEAEAEWIYEQAAANSAHHDFDLYIDTTEPLNETELSTNVGRLLQGIARSQ